VEDQQPAAGDLTADPAADSRRRHRMPVGKAKRVPVTPIAEATEVAEAAEAEVTESGDADEPTATVVFAERTPAGRRAPIVIGIAAALFVGAGAFAGATLQPYLAERAQADTKLDIARTAAEAITTLWTYTPENMESLGDRASRYLGGDFADQYRRYVDAIAPTNKQAQVTNSTQVVGAAVESLDGPDATALVYTNTTSTSPLSKNVPAMRYLSYRLTLRREDATWLVTKMSTVTSLDLTPQL